MDRPQILDSEALKVAFRCRYARMAQNLRQVKQVSTGSKVVHRECVSESMEADTHTIHAELFPEQLQIPKQLPLRQSPTLHSREDPGRLMPR